MPGWEVPDVRFANRSGVDRSRQARACERIEHMLIALLVALGVDLAVIVVLVSTIVAATMA